jgi:antitoxin component of MazEF toxin-antitoxin module
MFKYKSKINLANTSSKALRVGLPKEIVQILEVNAGDSIEWNVDVDDDKTVRIIAGKASESE